MARLERTEGRDIQQSQKERKGKDRQWRIQKKAQSKTESKQHASGSLTLCRIRVPPSQKSPETIPMDWLEDC